MSSTYAYLLVGGATQFSLRTAWLKLKYPAGQNEISRQPCEIFIPKFLGLNGRAPATMLTSTLYTTMSRELYMLERYKSFQIFNPIGIHRWAQESSAVDIRPAATRLDQQSHIQLSEKTSGLGESWWWTLRTYAKMNYLLDFGISNNSQCFLTMKITSCCWLFYAELKI